MPNNAFALPSCSRGASCTIRPDRAGEKNALPVPTTNAAMTNSQTCGWPRKSVTARAHWAAQRATSAVSITGRRPSRSASTPPPSMNATIGAMFAVNTTPSVVADPPLCSTAKAIATADIEVPSSDVV
jgi:hypothetical protein